MAAVTDASEQRWPPGLYVVATPIGNLADLSPRAAECLRRATVVAAEDTRTAGVLLKHSGSTARTLSLTEHNVTQRAPEIVAATREGVVALVSDAGTPVAIDPVEIPGQARDDVWGRTGRRHSAGSHPASRRTPGSRPG